MRNEQKYIDLIMLENGDWGYKGIYSKKVYFSSKDRLEVLYEGKQLNDEEEYYLYDIWENDEIMYTIDHPNSMTYL